MEARDLLAAWTLTMGLMGCASDLDTTRVVETRGTLGEEVYEVFCRRIASEEDPADVSGRRSRALCNGEEGAETATTPRLGALARNRARLVSALDRTMPDALHDDLRDFMVQLLPLYDPPEERLPRQTRAVAALLGHLAGDDAALRAFERMGIRKGYRPMRLALGLTRPILAYPQMDELARTALDTIDRGGPASPQWSQLLHVMALEMASAEPDPPGGGETTLEVARQLLFTEDDAFAAGPPRWVTRRDDRGIALIAAGGTGLPRPFVDRDADGLADVDALGRFIDASGLPLDVPPPFQVPREVGVPRDPAGRALRADGTHIYAYLDADRTLLAVLAREGVQLFRGDRAVALDLAYGLPPLLGAETVNAQVYGADTHDYIGYDTRHGALFDVLHAVGNLLRRPEIEDLLQVTEILMRDHEGELAGLIQTALLTDTRADRRDAALEPRNNLWDDLIQVMVWTAQEPGLLEALLRSFADPRSARLSAIYAAFMRYRDQVSYDPRPGHMNDLRRSVRLTDPVDRTRDDVRGNQSLYQRSISLIHDLNGVQMCNKEGARLIVGPIRWPLTGPGYPRCGLIQIDNVSELFAQAVVGTAEIRLKDRTLNELLRLASGIVSQDQMLENLSGITGFTTHPTAQALARFVFAPRNDFLQALVDPPLTRDGVEVESRHQGVIFSWEKEFVFDDGRPASRATFYDAMAPMLEAFDTYDRRTTGPGITPGWSGHRFLFGELVSAVHLHWPSPANDTTQAGDPGRRFFAHQSGGVRYEENIADAFDEGGLTLWLYDLSVALEGIEIRPGVDGITVMAKAAEVLVDPRLNSGLRYRDGRTTTSVNDGSRTVEATPLYQLLDGLDAMDEAFAAARPERHARWLGARGALVDQLLQTRPVGSGYRMENPRAWAALRVLLSFLRDRIRAHRDAGDLGVWAGGLASRAEDSIGGPLGSSIVGLLDAIQTEDPEARDQLAALMAYLLDESSGNDAFDNTLLSTADLMQVMDDDADMVPLVRALSSGIAPDAVDVVERGGDFTTEGGAVDATVQLLREVDLVDDQRTLPMLLANLVAVDPGEGETPLETILDVIAEVNRADPGAGTRMDVSDYREVMDRSRGFMISHGRGMERLYDILHHRRL